MNTSTTEASVQFRSSNHVHPSASRQSAIGFSGLMGGRSIPIRASWTKAHQLRYQVVLRRTPLSQSGRLPRSTRARRVRSSLAAPWCPEPRWRTAGDRASGESQLDRPAAVSPLHGLSARARAVSGDDPSRRDLASVRQSEPAETSHRSRICCDQFVSGDLPGVEAQRLHALARRHGAVAAAAALEPQGAIQRDWAAHRLLRPGRALLR